MANSIEWTVPNFVRYLNNVNTSCVNPIPSQHIQSGSTKFTFRIKFLGHNNDILEIYYLPSNTLSLTFKLVMFNKEGKESAVAELKEYQLVQFNRWHYVTSIRKDFTFNNYLLSDGSIRLKFLFSIESVKRNPSILMNDCDEQFGNDLKGLVSKGLFSDVITIKSAEGTEYKVHKTILALKSPVLKAHFEHNMAESRTNTVESALEAEVLMEVLIFIYSNKSPSVNDIPEKLLAAADYYQLNQLKSLCEKALLNTLSVENAIETLQLADMYAANTLKTLTLDFIKAEAKLIMLTDGWANVNSVEVLKDLCEYIFADSNCIKLAP